MTWMLIRLVLSLAFVGLILWFAARYAKKRGIGGGGAQGLIEVVARQRMGRSSTVNVVRIGDVVLVVGATEEQVTLLAEVDSETIDVALGERLPARAVRPPARPVASAPAPAPRYAAEGYEPHDHDAAHAGRGYDDQVADARAYDDDPYAGHEAGGYGDGHGDGHGDGYAEPRHDGRRAAGHHSDHRPDHRYGGGVHRPAAPAPSGGPLAGSVFDKNGWGTFVNELRERTVRRP
jgi:flagellar protein FliO/FliZ